MLTHDVFTWRWITWPHAFSMRFGLHCSWVKKKFLSSVYASLQVTFFKSVRKKITSEHVGNFFFFFNRCVCQPGWSGEMCDVNIDDCEKNPCSNGGQCIDEVDDYTCVCEAGFTGKKCQHSIDYCTAEPCQNGGSSSSKFQNILFHVSTFMLTL